MKKTLIALAVAAATAAFAENRTDGLYISHVHRGGGKFERPDNTLATLLWCWGHGSSAEVDCRLTKDGVPILFHDNNLARTPRGIPADWKKKLVKDMTWEELRDIDVGTYIGDIQKKPEFGRQFDYERIPTLASAFAAMQGRPTYLLFVDEKGATPQRIAEEAKKFGVQDQVYYTGCVYKNIVDWNSVVPGGKSLLWIGAWPKNHSAAEMERTEKHFEKIMNEVRANNFKYVTAVSLHTYYDPKLEDPFVPSTAYLKKLIKEFHEHGVKVCSIPFEGGATEEVYRKLWDLGMDGFSSDYPSVMFKVIKDLKDEAK